MPHTAPPFLPLLGGSLAPSYEFRVTVAVVVLAVGMIAGFVSCSRGVARPPAAGVARRAVEGFEAAQR